MDQKELDKVIDKIRKLIAKANGGSTAEEAALFAEKAQELLAQYNLSMSDVQEKEKGKLEADSTLWNVTELWVRGIHNVCAKFYFCGYFYAQRQVKIPSGYRAEDVHNYVGEKHNILVAQMFAEYLVKTGRRLVAQSIKDNEIPSKQQYKYRHAFLVAFAARIGQRLKEKQQEMMAHQTVTSEGTTLPALANMYSNAVALYEDWKKDNAKDIKPGAKGRVSDRNGILDGREAANNVSLNTQLGGGTKNPTHLLK